MDRIELDRKALLELSESLSDNTARRLIRNTLSREARRLKRCAAKELETEVKHGKDLGKTIGAKAHRDLSGLTVFSINRGKKYMYKGKPILFWLTRGSSDRRTGRGYNRGSLKGLKYMGKVLNSEAPQASKNLASAYAKAVERLVAKAQKQLNL